MLDPEFIEQAIWSASRGKKNRASVRRIVEDPGPTILKIIKELSSHTWQPPKHTITKLREGAHRKERAIQKPQFNDEQIIHHMLVRRVRAILEPKFYEWSCGCIPGKGPLLVKTKMEHWVHSYGDQPIYVAELDIRKFYQNIDTEILKRQISTYVKDDNFLEVLFKVIDSAAPGLPLGYYTSPWLGNIYLTPLDRHIIHVLHPDHYIRYMDNLYLFDTDKRHLHEVVDGIRSFCKQTLHLEIKPDWQVYRFEHMTSEGKVAGRAINCLGFVIHCDRTTLRKTLLKRIRAKAFRMHKKGRVTLLDARAMASYSGWLIHSDVYNYYRYWIKPNVSFPYCKEMISRDAKRSNENDKLDCSSQQFRNSPQ